MGIKIIKINNKYGIREKLLVFTTEEDVDIVPAIHNNPLDAINEWKHFHLDSMSRDKPYVKPVRSLEWVNNTVDLLKKSIKTL